ncbi:unnamed protein product [Urochloa humidicola]
MIRLKLDNADLIFIPLRKRAYWYLVVANFRHKKFEVIFPFKHTALVQEEGFHVATNFKHVFKAVISRSTKVSIYDMPTDVSSVSNYNNQNDSGIFVLQLLLSYHDNKRFQFKQEHAQPIRESLTYYICTHEENQIIMPQIKQVTQQYGIKLDNYTATRTGYSKD